MAVKECKQVTAIVVDADTVRIGGSAFVRERTCRSIDPIDSSEFFVCSNCNHGAGIVEFIPNYCPNCGRRVER